MRKDDVLHIRISKKNLDDISYLIDKGIFSNNNEAIRLAVRCILLKYKDLINDEKKKEI